MHYFVFGEDRRRFGNKNEKIAFSFCIPLTLHYFDLRSKIGGGSGIKMKKLHFHFVFRSPCTIFAVACEGWPFSPMPIILYFINDNEKSIPFRRTIHR